MTLRVLFVGEGPNELGGNFPDRSSGRYPGVLQTLALKLEPEGWSLGQAKTWKEFPKYQSQGSRDAEANTVLKIIFYAKEHQFDAIVFSRDSDGRTEVMRSIETGLRAAAENMPEFNRVAGGAAIRQLESWLLAVAGVSRSESFGKKRINEELEHLGTSLSAKDTGKLVELVEKSVRAIPNGLPRDARSLRIWCERVKAALSPEVPQL